MSDLLRPRQFGSFRASRLGLGTARLGAFWQGRAISDGIDAVRCAVDQGVSLVDTADVYARGLSERIVGRAIGRRENVVIMTKVGLLKTPLSLARAARASGRAPAAGGVKRGAVASTCFESEYVMASARASLRRLNRESIDVYLLHEPTAGDLRAARFGEAIARLTASGQVREWGASVRTADAAMAALDCPGLTWLQVPASVSNRQIVDQVAAHPRAANVSVIGLGVLGDGTLLSHAALGGKPRRQAVPELVNSAANLPGVDGVLLGMSTPVHVRENLAGLAQFDMRMARRS